jgi:hypothetical protein
MRLAACRAPARCARSTASFTDGVRPKSSAVNVTRCMGHGKIEDHRITTKSGLDQWPLSVNCEGASVRSVNPAGGLAVRWCGRHLRVPEPQQSVPHVLRNRRRCCNRRFEIQRDAARQQMQPAKAAAVGRIPHHGTAKISTVNADLMRSTGPR